MSVHRSFDEARKMLVLEVTDEVGISDMMSQVLAWFRDPQFAAATSPAPVLVDLSQANWMRMYREYEMVPDAVFNKVMEHAPIGPVAFVLKTATEQVMMAAINKTRPWPMEWAYFADRKEAEAWLMAKTEVEAKQ